LAKRLFKTPPAVPPASAEAGAALIRAAAIDFYDRHDGSGADWRAVVEALFRAAFDTLDKLPDEACRAVARRVHVGAYERVTEGPKGIPAASNGGLNQGVSSPSNTADWESNGPGGQGAV
jgi:hypothetical protein